jgi:hypothetical protein
MGKTHLGGLLQGSLGNPLPQWNTSNTPVGHTDTSNVTALNAAVKRLSIRPMNNVVRGAAVRGFTPNANAFFPAMRQRVGFGGSLRKSTIS